MNQAAKLKRTCRHHKTCGSTGNLVDNLANWHYSAKGCWFKKEATNKAEVTRKRNKQLKLAVVSDVSSSSGDEGNLQTSAGADICGTVQ